MTDRRSFLLTGSALALGAVPASRLLAVAAEQASPLNRYEMQGTDPLRDLIVINSLGFLDEPYAPPQPGPPNLISPLAVASAKKSGTTAVNLTIDAGTDFESTVEAIGKYSEFIRTHPDDLLKIFTTADILEAKAQKKVGIIFGFQNAAMVGDKAERIDTFADLGVRSIQLTYNPLNQLGGGSMAPGDPGLTPFGRQVVARLNARRVIVDLSHSGHQICLDAAHASTSPISINHTGCKAIVDVPRNKTDEELRLVAEKGGYVGIYFLMFVAQGRRSTVDDVVAHMEHAIKVCGEDHVGFGSDYGIVELGEMQAVREFWAGFVNKRIESHTAAAGEDPNLLPFSEGLMGPEQLRNLYRALSKRGHKAALIEKVMGRNYLRFAKEVWGA